MDAEKIRTEARTFLFVFSLIMLIVALFFVSGGGVSPGMTGAAVGVSQEVNRGFIGIILAVFGILGVFISSKMK